MKKATSYKEKLQLKKVHLLFEASGFGLSLQNYLQYMSWEKKNNILVYGLIINLELIRFYYFLVRL